MENASKALLIAGSILIVILLIAMGVRVFTSTQGTTDSVETTMNATEVAMFNNKFLTYAGSGKSATQVRALANVVISHNGVEKQLKVSFQGSYDATTIISSLSSLDTSKKYTIKMQDIINNNGLIDTITFSAE